MTYALSGGRSVALSLALACSATAAAAPQSPTAPPAAELPAPSDLPAAAPADEPAGPWRASEALGLPEWFRIGGTFRTRYESFDEQFRAIGGFIDPGEVRGFQTRTLLEMTVRDRFLSATAELQDSRIYSGVTNAPLNAGIVNTVEFLQAYLAGEFTDAFEANDSLRVQFGRHTMDVGGRRLVARNRFRNTINAFTGLNAQWKSEDGVEARAFFTYPVNRLPGTGGLNANDETVRTDEERSTRRFWGGHVKLPDVAAETNAELYLFGLDESVGRLRDINTLGTRWAKPRQAGEAYWELESAYQFGETNGLDVNAWFAHATLGYALDDGRKSRAEILFDYVTGDNDPADDTSERFDTLFGARRFEFGPTGFFGAFARQNLISPGLRYVTKPAPRWEVMLTHRFHYLESDRDAWTTSGLQDATGAAGNHIGNLSEFRVRYDLVPKSFRIEFGAAYLAAGDFIDDAPNATTQGDTLYGYVQTNFTF